MKDFLYPIITDQRRDLTAQVVQLPLILLSFFYQAAVRLMLAGYSSGILHRQHLNAPVISIGNLTTGGVGKTPMVMYLVKLVKSQKLKPVILTRGYSSDGRMAFSDEAKLLEDTLNIPVVVNPNRYQGGVEAVKRYKPDVIVLDDGFQHWRLFRNLDIVLIDATNPFGHGRLLPAGLLREPLSSLKRADMVVLTKCDWASTGEVKETIRSINPRVPIIETIHRPASLSDIYNGHSEKLSKLVQPLVAFCGIGNPHSFKTTLESLQAEYKDLLIFDDHHAYGADDMNKIKDACAARGTKVVVTTQKDAVKLAEFKDFWKGFNVYSLNIELAVTQGEHEFASRIHHLLHG